MGSHPRPGSPGGGGLILPPAKPAVAWPAVRLGLLVIPLWVCPLSLACRFSKSNGSARYPRVRRNSVAVITTMSRTNTITTPATIGPAGGVGSAPEKDLFWARVCI